MSTHNLKPLSEVIKELKEKGFEKDFRYKEGKLVFNNDNKSFSPQDLKIIEEYRFEGDSDPGMMTILYALETQDGLKGTITNAYGANADRDLAEFMKKIEEA